MEEPVKKIKLLIADDHQMMLDGLRSFLTGEPDIAIVAEAKNGLEVLDRIHYDEIDVAVIDISMPELDGHQTVLRMKQSHPGIKVLILSLHKDAANIGNLWEAGVDGYVIKDRGSEELVKAIRVLAAGGEYFDNEVNKIKRALQNRRNHPADKAIQLTSRETEVLELLAQSLSSREIGDRLHISESTVETHKKNLIQKLSLPSARHLRTYAAQKFNKPE